MPVVTIYIHGTIPPEAIFFFYELIYIYIFVLKFLWFRPCQCETFRKTFNHRVFDSGGIIKNYIKKLRCRWRIRRLVIGRKTSFYLHRLSTLQSDIWDKLLFEISIPSSRYFSRSSNFIAYIIIFECDWRQLYLFNIDVSQIPTCFVTCF